MEILQNNIKHLCQQANSSLEVVAKELNISKAWLMPNKQGFQYLPALVRLSEKFGVRLDDLLQKDLTRPSRLLAEKDLRFLTLDVDGVLTDGGMYYSERGEGDEFKKFNAKDGMGIMHLQKIGFKIGLISSGTNKQLIQRRATKLGIQYVHAGDVPKNEILEKWCKKLNMTPSNIIHLGDDVNDISLIDIVGFSACPADAVSSICQKVDLVLSKNGGKGCVREFIDEYLIPYLKNK